MSNTMRVICVVVLFVCVGGFYCIGYADGYWHGREAEKEKIQKAIDGWISKELKRLER